MPGQVRKSGQRWQVDEEVGEKILGEDSANRSVNESVGMGNATGVWELRARGVANKYEV